MSQHKFEKFVCVDTLDFQGNSDLSCVCNIKLWSKFKILILMKQNKSRGRVDLGDLLKCNLGLKIFHCPVSISVEKPETLCEAVNYDY